MLSLSRRSWSVQLERDGRIGASKSDHVVGQEITSDYVCCSVVWEPNLIGRRCARKLTLWPPYGIGQAIIFLPSGFYLLSFFFLSSFSSPTLSGRRLDVYHTSAHDVALVRIYTVSQKTPHLWLAITLTHVNGS